MNHLPPVEELINQFKPLIHKLAWRSHIEFDDAVQESIVVLMDAHRKFDENLGIKFSTYLWRALHNRINLPRNDYRKLVLQMEKQMQSIESLTEHGFDVKDEAQDLERVEFDQRLKVAFTVLTPRQRQIIRMRYFDDQSCAAIGEELGISRQAVLDSINQSIKKMKVVMEG